MKLWLFAFILALLLVLPVSAREWLDEFDEPDLNGEWFRITDRPVEQGSVTIEDGKLLINDPNGDFGHLVTDGRPLVLRKAPDGDFSISALVETDPPPPAQSYWIGLFVVGKDGDHAVLAENWAALNIGGGGAEVKALIGSMIDNAWNDKGHFDIPEWPIYLKLEKTGNQYTGYFKQEPADEWTMVGGAWAHDGMEEPELAGLGFINSWGGANLTLIVEYFSLEGESVIPMAVGSAGKLSSKWGQIKLSY